VIKLYLSISQSVRADERHSALNPEQTRVVLAQVQPTRNLIKQKAFLPQVTGDVTLEDGVTVTGGFSLDAGLTVYGAPSSYSVKIEVYGDARKLYQLNHTLLRYLPAEFEVQDDLTDDLKQFLQVVAIHFDEFWNWTEDFLKIFDPDRCPAKYLPYLAKLINYPLNTRGFDSEVASIKQAAEERARRQLRTAVDVYKRKGMKEAFEILFFGLGYYIELVELYTKNYVSFFDAIPPGEYPYDSVSNPEGWFKSPYFGVKILSLNQQTFCSSASSGAGQPWRFDEEDLKEVIEAIHSVRPVHTVLYWLDYYFDLCDKFTTIDDVPTVSDIDWHPEDRFGYVDCDPDDPLYFRGDPSDPYNRFKGDPRLDGVVREWFPQPDPDLPGPTVEASRLKRHPEKGFCHPRETLTTEIGEYTFATEPFCTAVMRNAGQIFRDGTNLFPRDGSNPHRIPSAFGGRNGYYWRDDVWAPFYPHEFDDPIDAPGSLVPDRSGCYMTDMQVEPLYQLDEEILLGVTKYYNRFEFEEYMRSGHLGIIHDPE
jgi:phage tail-like protein